MALRRIPGQLWLSEWAYKELERLATVDRRKVQDQACVLLEQILEQDIPRPDPRAVPGVTAPHESATSIDGLIEAANEAMRTIYGEGNTPHETGE